MSRLPLRSFITGRLLAGLWFMLLAHRALATTVSTGGLAIVGYQDNATTDFFTVLATEDITAGTVVYFTNNGWSNSGSQFNGVSPSSFDAAGGQQLMKFTVTTTITSGTIFSSADTTSSAFTWIKHTIVIEVHINGVAQAHRRLRSVNKREVNGHVHIAEEGLGLHACTRPFALTTISSAPGPPGGGGIGRPLGSHADVRDRSQR